MVEGTQDKFRMLSFRISTRQKSVFFPIDGRDLIEAARKIGYSVTTTPLPQIARGRLSFEGNFAQKGEVILDLNTERCILGVSAKSYDIAIKAFDELCSSVLNEFNVDLAEGSRFYEIMSEIKYNSMKNPLESISDMFQRNYLVSNIGKILEQDLSMFTLRFVTRGKVPNQDEWFDITIEPDILMPTQRYAISIVFRSKDKSVVERFGEKLESNLLKIIETIEGS